MEVCFPGVTEGARLAAGWEGCQEVILNAGKDGTHLDPQRWVTPQTPWLPGEKGTEDLSGFLGPGFPLSSLLTGLKWLQNPEQKLSRGDNTGISSCDEETLEFHLEEDSKGNMCLLFLFWVKWVTEGCLHAAHLIQPTLHICWAEPVPLRQSPDKVHEQIVLNS